MGRPNVRCKDQLIYCRVTVQYVYFVVRLRVNPQSLVKEDSLIKVWNLQIIKIYYYNYRQSLTERSDYKRYIKIYLTFFIKEYEKSCIRIPIFYFVMSVRHFILNLIGGIGECVCDLGIYKRIGTLVTHVKEHTDVFFFFLSIFKVWKIRVYVYVCVQGLPACKTSNKTKNEKNVN